MIIPVNNYVVIRKRSDYKNKILIVNTMDIDNIGYVEASNNPTYKVNDIVIYNPEKIVTFKFYEQELIFCKDTDIYAILGDDYE